jgi:hypothetical protein
MWSSRTVLGWTRQQGAVKHSLVKGLPTLTRALGLGEHAAEAVEHLLQHGCSGRVLSRLPLCGMCATRRHRAWHAMGRDAWETPKRPRQPAMTTGGHQARRWQCVLAGSRQGWAGDGFPSVVSSGAIVQRG